MQIVVNVIAVMAVMLFVYLCYVLLRGDSK